MFMSLISLKNVFFHIVSINIGYIIKMESGVKEDTFPIFSKKIDCLSDSPMIAYLF